MMSRKGKEVVHVLRERRYYKRTKGKRGSMERDKTVDVSEIYRGFV